MDVLQYKYNNLKIKSEKGVNKPMSKHDAALQEFINTGIDRTKVASTIYSINQNNKKGIGFTGGNSGEVILKPFSDKETLKTHFVSKSEKVNTASCSEPENQKTKVVNNSKSKALELQVLKKTESESQKPRFQRQKAVNAKSQSKTKGSELVVWKKTKQNSFRHKTQRKFKGTANKKALIILKLLLQLQDWKLSGYFFLMQ